MRSLSGLKRQEGSGVADAEREVCNKCSRVRTKDTNFVSVPFPGPTTFACTT